MAITPERKAQLDAIIANLKEPKPKEAGFLSSVGESLGKRAAYAGETAKKVWGGKIHPLEGSVRAVGTAIGAVGDVVGQAGISAVKAVTPDTVEKKFMESAPVKAGAEAISSVASKYQDWKSRNQRAAEDLEALVNIASVLPVGAAGKAAGGAVARGASEVAEIVGKTAKSVGKTAAGAVETAGKVGGVIREAGLSAKETLKQVPARAAANKEAMTLARESMEELPEKFRVAVTNGVRPRDAAIVRELSPKEMTAARKMISAADDFSKNRAAPDPTGIVGEEVTKRVRDIDELAASEGKKLGDFASQLGSSKVSSVPRDVVRRIREVPGMENANIVPGKNGRYTLDLERTALGSSLSRGERTRIAAAFSDIYDKDGLQLHRLRQNLFEILGGKKKAKVVLTGTEEKAMEAIRQGIADALEAGSVGYKEANRKVAEILSVRSAFNKLYSGLGNAPEDLLNARGAQLARRLTSNMKSAPEFENLFREAEKVLGKYGKKYDTSVQNLQDVMNAIERYFDVSKDTGFAGQVNLGTQDVGKGLTGMLLEKGKQAVGLTPEAARDAFKKMFEP